MPFAFPRAVAAAVVLLAGSLALPAFAHEYEAGTIHVGHPWSRPTAAPGATGVVYLTLENEGTQPDRLVGASSPYAERAELHETVMEGEIMRMRAVEALELAPGAGMALEPGGNHLMLIRLDRPLAVGDRVPVVLEFEEAGQVEIEAVVEPMGTTGPSHHGH